MTRRTVTFVYIQHMQLGGAKKDAFHRWQHRALDAWVAPLPWLAEQAAELTCVPPEAIRVIPFGIDLSPFAGMPDASDARAALDLPAGAFLVGTVGRLDPGKGQEYLLRAVAMLRDRGIDVHALLVGEETRDDPRGYARLLQGLTAELRIGDRVHVRPFMERIAVAYAAMDLFALTSLAETYGMVTIEAMAAGLPVIGTNTGGTADLIDDGHTGVLVPPADPGALAEQIARLHADTELRRDIGAAARRTAFSDYSHTAQCELLEQLCERIP